jgi:hypothetical protein
MLRREPGAVLTQQEPLGNPGLGELCLAESTSAAKRFEPMRTQRPKSFELARMHLRQNDAKSGFYSR